MNLTSSSASNFGKHITSSKETTMNLTTIASNPTNWKRIKGQYVAAAAGVALAVSAVLAFGATNSREASVPVPPQRGASAATLDIRPSADHVFYIVANEAERVRLDGILSTDSHVTDPQFSQRYTVLSASDAQTAYVDASELMAHGVSFSIIDTRVPAPAPAQRPVSQADVDAAVLSTEMAAWDFTAPQSASAATMESERAAFVTPQEQYIVGQTQRAGSPASIAASGAERSAYVTLQEQLLVSPTDQRTVAQADIDAAVLSTEMAAYDFGGVQSAVSESTLGAERSAYVTRQEQLLVSPMEQRTVSQADIAASVLSTELANYAVPATQVASDADIMAGVVSSERATFSQ